MKQGDYRLRTIGQNYVYEEDVNNGEAERYIAHLQNTIQTYTELEEMAKAIGDTEGRKAVSEKINETRKRLSNFEDCLRRTTKQMNFNATVDRIANSASSMLMSMANVLGGNSSSSNSASSSYSNGDTGKQISQNSSSMSMSDQANYNSLRNTYNKWANDLMQMKNANGRYQNGYTANDKRHAQSEMKRIRNDALKRYGKEIPYNSIEDW